MNDLIVIGGGFCGVHLAVELERLLPGARVLVLEGATRLGGRARSFVPPGGEFALDLGAHYLGQDHVRAMSLVRRLTRGDEVYSNLASYGADPGSRNYLDGTWRVTRKSTSSFELQGLSRDISLSESVRMLQSLTAYLGLEASVNTAAPWLTPDAKRLDQITAAEWIDSQKGPAWIREMWGLAMLDIISVWPSEISMLYWLWYNAANGGFLKVANDHRGGPQEFSLTIGMQGLLERHAKEIRGQVITGAPVTQVLHDADQVTVVTADGTRRQARRVAVAASPRAAGAQISYTPELSGIRKRFHAQPVGHAVKAVFLYSTPWWRDSGGVHFMSYSAGARARNVEWALDTSHPSGRQLSLSAFVSDKLIDRAGTDLTERKRLLCEGMVELCGDPRAGEPTHVEVFDWREQPWVGGGPNTNFGKGVLSEAAGPWNPAEPGGRLFFAAAEYATSFPGYVEGALASAEDVARRISWALAGELGFSRPPSPPEQQGHPTNRVMVPLMNVAQALLAPAGWLAGRR